MVEVCGKPRVTSLATCAYIIFNGNLFFGQSIFKPRGRKELLSTGPQHRRRQQFSTHQYVSSSTLLGIPYQNVT